ncbi:hypothetical protein B0H17DRAFT_1151715 [Mycena rosella]|uniref:Uncharacterized protein n=1 Tax=Mycena rosella TaxID=1033263 RepID=A0AAD7BIH3_MYCRO|nr:hypothetical protein B0H17DRAFT_1151715 [Mycena rosella]
MNTHVGEGFQQEMSIMDENEETMARIQMAFDEWLKSQEGDEKESVLGPSNSGSSAHWKLGLADTQVTTVCIEACNQHNPSFREFNLKLREYLAHYHPLYFVRPDQDMQVSVNHVTF